MKESTILATQTIEEIFSKNEVERYNLKLAKHPEKIHALIESYTNILNNKVASIIYLNELLLQLKPIIESCQDCIVTQGFWSTNKNIDEIFDLNNWLKGKRDKLRSELTSKVKKSIILKRSFERNGVDYKNDNIGNACSILRSMQYIEGTTTLPDFKKIFSGKEVANKINWTGNINELRYFIKQLIDKKKILKPKEYWQVAINCFNCKNKSGDDLTVTMLTGNSTIPDKTDILDKAVDFF